MPLLKKFAVFAFAFFSITSNAYKNQPLVIDYQEAPLGPIITLRLDPIPFSLLEEKDCTQSPHGMMRQFHPLSSFQATFYLEKFKITKIHFIGGKDCQTSLKENEIISAGIYLENELLYGFLFYPSKLENYAEVRFHHKTEGKDYSFYGEIKSRHASNLMSSF